MRKFQLSAARSTFTGFITVQYNKEGVLWFIDVSQAELDIIQLTYVFRNMPLLADSIEEFCKASRLNVVEMDFEVTFDMWFDDYNYRVNKKKALQLWSKMSKLNQVTCYFSNKSYDRFIARKGIEKKYPDTYLRQEAYLNEWDKIK